jgi:hypothetical protein
MADQPSDHATLLALYEAALARIAALEATQEHQSEPSR